MPEEGTAHATASGDLDLDSPRTADLEQQIIATARARTGREVDELPPVLKHLPQKDHHQDIKLKRIYAVSLLIALGIQLLIADGVFVAYVWAGENWRVSPDVVNVWMGAAVVQVIGVVIVVTRYLFPRRDLQA